MIKQIFLLTLIIGLIACSDTNQDTSQVQQPEQVASLLTLTPDQQLDYYRHIEEYYPVHIAKRGDHVYPLPKGDKQIQPAVLWRDKNYTDINAFMTDARISGLLVLQDGKILMEEYALGREPDDRWTSFSVGKSVTAILLGAAIKDGYIQSLDEPVTKYIPDLKGSAYDNVNIRQLITMSSGVKWNEDYEDPNSDVAQASFWPGEPGMNPLVSYMRKLPQELEPGSKFVYKTGETDMAGILVANAVGKGLAEYLQEKLWQPYGMERDAVWMTDRGDMERGGCCISMTLHDYARVGQFMLNGGKVDGEQVIPEWYLTEATSSQVSIGRPGGYGYFWWIRDDGTYAAQGIFGQQIRISNEKNLVVVINSAFPSAVGPEYRAALEAVYEGIEKAVD